MGRQKGREGEGEESGNLLSFGFNLGRRQNRREKRERERGTGHYMVQYTERSPHRLER